MVTCGKCPIAEECESYEYKTGVKKSDCVLTSLLKIKDNTPKIIVPKIKKEVEKE